MAIRAVLETLKFLEVRELLTTAALVSTAWKSLVYSEEILLHQLSDREEDEANSALPLYQRVKKAMETVNYLLCLAKGEMLVWNISKSAQPPLIVHHAAFIDSSIYVPVSSSTAIITGGDGQETLCIQVSVKGGKVTLLPALLRKHTWHGAALLKRTLYVSGGRVNNRSQAYTEKYEDGHWTTIADMHIPRHSHTLSPYRSRIYAFGGTNHQRVLTSIEYYNGNIWTQAPMSLPTNRDYPSIIPMLNKLLLVGGCPPLAPSRFLALWDEASGSWKAAHVKGAEFARSNAVAERQGRIYMYDFGGNRRSWPMPAFD